MQPLWSYVVHRMKTCCVKLSCIIPAYSMTLCCVYAHRAGPEEESQDDSTYGYIQTARDYLSSSVLDGVDVDGDDSYSPRSRVGAQGLGHGIARAHMVAKHMVCTHVLDDDASYSHVSSVRQGSDETRGPGTEEAVGVETADVFGALGPNFESDDGGCGSAEYTEVKLRDREREIKEALLMQGMRAMGEVGFPLLTSSGEERAHDNQMDTNLISSSAHASRRCAADLKAQHADERTAASARGGDDDDDDDDYLFPFQKQTLASGQVQAAAASVASVVTVARREASKRKAIPSAEPAARARNSETSSTEFLKSPLHSDFI